MECGQVPGSPRVQTRPLLDAGRATLELFNPAQVAMIDEVEVGRRVAPRLRVAFEVADAAGVTETLVEAGAELVAPPDGDAVGLVFAQRPPRGAGRTSGHGVPGAPIDMTPQ
jgi:hypothetical protein